MKKTVKILVTALIGFLMVGLAGCQMAQTMTDQSSSSGSGSAASEKSLYSDFENYPKGKQKADGLLTLTNEANTSVLVFTDSVSGANYIGTIPALSSINVSLEPGKFYSIVSVTKNAYEDNPALAVQTSVLVYYSAVQVYSVSVAPENMTGTATWIFNNYTSYWASIEKIDASGETYAVIAPYAKQVCVPVQTNRNYDYKVVYKKQLKYNGNIIAISNKTSTVENDTASFMNLTTFTTDLYGDATKDNSDLAPTVKFVNHTGKTIRVYNGQVQLTDTGINSEDYTLASGLSAFFTGFTEGTSLSSLNIRNISWEKNYYCTGTSMTLRNGYVYTVIVTKSNYSGSSSQKNDVVLNWSVEKTSANKFYTEE